MRGRDAGSLNIYAKTNNSEQLVWSDRGDKGNRWLFGQTPLSAVTTYKVEDSTSGIRTTRTRH